MTIRLPGTTARKAWLLLVLLLVSAVPASAGDADRRQPPRPARAGREIRRKLAASPDGLVTIRNPVGFVRVVGWRRNEVEVSGALGERVRQMVFTRSGDRVNIDVIAKGLGDSTDLEVNVPALSRLDVNTHSAGIVVLEMLGPVDLESMNGGIEVSGSPREVRAGCVSCEMELRAAADLIRGETVNGPIHLEDAVGLVDLSTVSGRLEVRTRKARAVSMTSVTGPITFDGVLGRDGSLYAETHNGIIQLAFPGNLEADFDVVNIAGPMENGFAGEVVHVPGRATARELRFSTGSGGARIKVRSFSGPVALIRR